MPRRETRHDIERDLAAKRRKRLGVTPGRELDAEIERNLAEMRKRLESDNSPGIEVRVVRGAHKLIVTKGRKRRRRGDGSMPALVEPPRGPKPFAGGAATPLEFD